MIRLQPLPFKDFRERTRLFCPLLGLQMARFATPSAQNRRFGRSSRRNSTLACPALQPLRVLPDHEAADIESGVGAKVRALPETAGSSEEDPDFEPDLHPGTWEASSWGAKRQRR